jgi:hypothetical protein
VTAPDWLTAAASAGVATCSSRTRSAAPRARPHARGPPRPQAPALSPVDDDVLASSRFTIPVSVLLPTSGDRLSVDAVEALLDVRVPRNRGDRHQRRLARRPRGAADRYDLKAYEVFFRRTLQTSTVRAIYRSGTDPRLLVVDCLADSPRATR